MCNYHFPEEEKGNSQELSTNKTRKNLIYEFYIEITAYYSFVVVFHIVGQFPWRVITRQIFFLQTFLSQTKEDPYILE